MDPTRHFMMPSPGRILSSLHPTPEKTETLAQGVGVDRVLCDRVPTAARGLFDCGHTPVPLTGEKNVPPSPLTEIVALRSSQDDERVVRRSVRQNNLAVVAPSPPSSAQSSPAILRDAESAPERRLKSPFNAQASSACLTFMGSDSSPPAPARINMVVNSCAISVNTSYWNVLFSRRVPCKFL